jgi:hypothetical protein
MAGFGLRTVPKNVVFRTQKEAVDFATNLVRNEAAAQVVVHGASGSMRRPYLYGLPTIQRSRVRSSLGRKAIQQAVSSVLRKQMIEE